jgi:hypothetical protein
VSDSRPGRVFQPGDPAVFTTADKIDGPIAGLARARSTSPEYDPGSLLVVPETSLEHAKQAWDAFLDIRDVILNDPACYDDIDGTREMNRTGATRLAVPFGLSIEQYDFHESQVEDASEHTFDHRFIVTVRVSKGARHVDGIGSCRLSEIAATTKAGKSVPIGQREHFAMTRAWTRATKRAIADILGGTEVE